MGENMSHHLRIRDREVSYTFLQAAQLMCQYAELIEEARSINEPFRIWYDSLSSNELILMKKDQNSRKAKQAAKIAGKVAANAVSLLFGIAHWSKSATKDIAESAVYNRELWMHISTAGITYNVLREM